ncbi:hypothetical protein [Nocardia arizonensis]|uniref:hypothetical protein n=1 Tax=Nocardia arizonensis TaxID=1141647 RepID=UPI0006D020F6|nr:hypothetical protein [Nocardia arizonensis]
MFVPALLPQARSETLLAAAFGDLPGIAAAELPPARGAHDRWLRAVVLGGQGFYAAARAQLRRIPAETADPVLLSLSASAQGSLLRQLGRHAAAAVYDGRALALLPPRSFTDRMVAEPPAAPDVSTKTPGAPESPVTLAEFAAPPDATDAVCDALTGLAADAIGTGRIALAERLLDRVGPFAVGRPRATIREHWVSAETALAAGRPADARPRARAALDLAERCPSVRHRVKSALLVAAAAMACGDLDEAAEYADSVARQCREHELMPLAWACAMLRAGLADPDAAAEAAACGELIAGRGGHFRPAGSV